MKRDNLSFMLWGGYIVASLIVEVVGFYFSALVGVVLLGMCLAGAVMLAAGKNPEGLAAFEKKHTMAAKVLAAIGKVDVICSLLVLPWIVRAFYVSMGWKFDFIGEEYAVWAAYAICFLYGVLLVSGVGRYLYEKIRAQA